MAQHLNEDLVGVEFLECNLTNTRLVAVIMHDAVIDGSVTNLVVRLAEVMAYAEAELDRRHPLRPLIRSNDLTDLRRAWWQLRTDWAATMVRMRRPPGIERRSVNDDWSPVQTLRHLVFAPAYEPPNRLMISWDISPQRQIETHPARSSEVEVCFVAETPLRTVHRRRARDSGA